MSNILDAQASTPGHSIPSTQNPTTTPTVAHDNSRNPVEQGNTQSEKKLNKPLSHWQKADLVQAGMNRAHNCNFKEWGHNQLASLLAYNKDDSLSLNLCQEFFTDLLLFLAKPKVSKAFNREVEDGLKRLQCFTTFINSFRENRDYDEWASYCSVDDYESDNIEFIHLAKEYLTPEELELVLAPEEDPRAVRQQARFDAVYKEEKKKLDDQVAAIQAARPAIFKSDEEMIEALDRHFPNVDWPADKLTVIYDPVVKHELELKEKARIYLENETPEQKQARELRLAIKEAIMPKMPPVKPIPVKPTSRKSTTRKKA